MQFSLKMLITLDYNILLEHYKSTLNKNATVVLIVSEKKTTFQTKCSFFSVQYTWIPTSSSDLVHKGVIVYNAHMWHFNAAGIRIVSYQ